MHMVQSQFKEAGGTWIAAADARSFSTGVENARYEGPLKLEIPIPIKVSPLGVVGPCQSSDSETPDL